MSVFKFANNVQTTLAAPITTVGQTTITLSSAANLPTLTGGQVMALTLNDAATQDIFEIVYVTAIVGAVLTVIRGQEGTAANTWLANDNAYASDTAAILNSFALVNSSNAFTAGTITGVTGVFSGALSAFTVLANAAVISGRNSAFAFANGVSYPFTSSIGASTGEVVAGITGTAFLFTIEGVNDVIAVDGSGHMGVSGYVVSPSFFATALTSISSPSSLAGDVVAQRSAQTGAFIMGGATANAAMDGFITNASGISFTKGIFGSYCAVFGGAYTNSSDAVFKKNVLPITGALELLAKLKPSSFKWIADDQPDFGFIAQEVEGVLPDIVRTDVNGKKGIVYSSLIPILAAALLQHLEEHH